MKLKNIEIGMRLKVKKKQREPCDARWYDESKGLIGTVIAIDDTGDPATVRLQFENGCAEWGTHKGLRKLKEGEE